MKVMKIMARQGDVLIINSNHKSLRKETKKRLFGKALPNKFDFKQEKRFPLAYGEVSGHAHAVYQQEGIDLLYSKDVAETQKILLVAEGTTAPLQHEEHEAIQLTEGNNAVLGQHEWRLQKVVRAAD